MIDKRLSISFIILGDSNDISGGHIYNKRIVSSFTSNLSCKLIYVPDETSLINAIENAEGEVLIDAWGLHKIEPFRINKEFHLLAHHPIELDDTVNGDHKKEEIFWGKASSIVTTSRYVKEFIENRCSTPVKSILPGIDPVVRKQKYNKLPNQIVGFASLIERKGDLLLLEAMKSSLSTTIRRYGPAPDQGYLEQVENKSLELTNSEFIYEGVISETQKEEIISRSDLAVFPTYYESFGMAIQECLESKIPVLVNDFAGARERFGELGVRYIEPNAEAWQMALDKYCHQEKEYAQLIEEIKVRQNKFGNWKSQSQLLVNHFKEFTPDK